MRNLSNLIWCIHYISIKVVFPNGVPDELHEVPINIDQTPVVKGEKGDGRVLVSPYPLQLKNFYNKPISMYIILL